MREIRTPVLVLAVIFGVGILSATALLQEKGGGDETGPYDVTANWPLPFARPGYIQGSQGGVFAESPNRIFLLNRGELKLPDKLPAGFNGSWGSIGQATQATPELRNCILVVDANGKLLESWTQWDRLFQGGRGPHHVKILKYDLNGRLLYSWGTYGTFPGAVWGVHQFSVDAAGNLYAAETFGGRTQKFRPKPGADPAKLVGAPAPLMTRR